MKRILVMLIVIIMMFVLAACGEDAPVSANTRPEETKPSASVTQSTQTTTKPATTPTEPTNAPTQPTAKPEESTVPATEPTVKPTEPTVQPTEPTEQPTEPTELTTPPHAHDYTSTVTQPTCTEEGYTTYTCSCGDTYRDNSVEAMGHNWAEANCTTAKTCSVCGETDGNAKGHEYMEGMCVHCGAEDPEYKPEKDTKTILDELENTIESDVESTIDALQTEWETLKAEVTTYELYVSNLERIETFYEKVYDVTEQLCVKMYDYALDYAEIVMAADETFGDKYDFLGDIYDNVYEGIGDEIYDEIYDGILDEMYDEFYDGVLSDAYDSIPYAEWSSVRSEEYRMWSDMRSDVYRKNSDSRTDVYRFSSDIRGELYAHDKEGAEKDLQRFKEKVARLKGEDGYLYQSHPELSQVTTLEALEALIEKDVSETINGLNAEWEAIKEEIDTYEKYVANVERIEALYDKIYLTTHELLLRQYEYTFVYVKMIMDSDMSAKDKYNAMDDLYDCIYKTACDEIQEEIYDDLLDDMESAFYKGIIKDAKDDVKYSEWYDVYTNEYEMWYETRTDVYGDWYEMRSDIYGIYYDIRSELYGNDIEGATKALVAFEERFLRLTGQKKN